MRSKCNSGVVCATSLLNSKASSSSNSSIQREQACRGRYNYIRNDDDDAVFLMPVRLAFPLVDSQPGRCVAASLCRHANRAFRTCWNASGPDPRLTLSLSLALSQETRPAAPYATSTGAPTPLNRTATIICVDTREAGSTYNVMCTYHTSSQ